MTRMQAVLASVILVVLSTGIGALAAGTQTAYSGRSVQVKTIAFSPPPITFSTPPPKNAIIELASVDVAVSQASFVRTTDNFTPVYFLVTAKTGADCGVSIGQELYPVLQHRPPGGTWVPFGEGAHVTSQLLTEPGAHTFRVGLDPNAVTHDRGWPNCTSVTIEPQPAAAGSWFTVEQFPLTSPTPTTTTTIAAPSAG